MQFVFTYYEGEGIEDKIKGLLERHWKIICMTYIPFSHWSNKARVIIIAEQSY